MENNRLRNKNIITAILVLVILLLSFVSSLSIYKNQDFTLYSNDIRLELNNERLQIEQVFLENDNGNSFEHSVNESGDYPVGHYPYIVFDTAGKIYFADPEWQYNKDDNVVVEEMIQQDKGFSKKFPDCYKCSFVLDRDNECMGFLVYLIPHSFVENSIYTNNMLYSFVPVGMGIILSCIIILFRTIYCNRRILRPLQLIHQSSQAIIKGDYDVEVQRVYEEDLQVNEVGNLTYSFELMRDELKAKQLSEQSLRKSQQELISCISHDLRTPISTIKAYGEGLRDGIACDDECRNEFTDIIINKTNLLEGMISELLEYSNTQLNKMDINKIETYFREYMIDIARELRIYVNQNGIDFESNIMEEDVIIPIDTRRITEVLYNLVENSMKYIGEVKGKISLTVKREKEVISIHVLDNGIGISAEDIPYVFDKFYRAEKSRSSNISGSGLGLSICKYIVNQHGGEIYCRSRKTHGSEFWFTLSI